MKYKIADICLEVTGCSSVEKWDNLEPFLISKNEKTDCHIRVKYAEQDPAEETEMKLLYGDAYHRVWELGRLIIHSEGYFSANGKETLLWKNSLKYDRGQRNIYELYLKNRNTSQQNIFSFLSLHQIMARFQRMVLHSSYIARNGQGIVFTAPSGTGKSTQAQLWADTYADVKIINGDRSIISCDKGIPMVHGVPFCGSSGICRNLSLPLKGVIVLRQGKENQLRRLKQKEAVKLLLSESAIPSWDRGGTGNILDLMMHIVETVPMYYFSCLPDSSAVQLLSDELFGDQIL